MTAATMVSVLVCFLHAPWAPLRWDSYQSLQECRTAREFDTITFDAPVVRYVIQPKNCDCYLEPTPIEPANERWRQESLASLKDARDALEALDEEMEHAPREAFMTPEKAVNCYAAVCPQLPEPERLRGCYPTEQQCQWNADFSARYHDTSATASGGESKRWIVNDLSETRKHG